MDSLSRILLSEATQLLNMTRRRIELTAALLVKAAAAEQLPSPRGLSQRSGLSEEELTKQLSQVLPGVVDKLTPAGRMPNLAELSRASEMSRS